MSRVHRIINAAGQPEAYDHGRVVSSILSAIRKAGFRDEHLADQIASVVEFTLGRYYGETTPTVENVSHSIEQALRSLEGSVDGASRIADAYVEAQLQQAQLRQLQQATTTTRTSSAAPRSKRSAQPGLPGVFSSTDGGLQEWQRERVQAALIREHGVSLDQAADVTEAVEGRLAALGVERVTTGLIRELTDLELLERGMLAARGTTSQLSVPLYDVDQEVFPQGEGMGDSSLVSAADLEGWLARRGMQQFLLGTVHSPDVVDAHGRASLELLGVDQPARVAGLTVDTRQMLRAGAGLDLNAFFPEACTTWDDATARISDLLALAAESTWGTITLAHFDSALEALVRSPRDASRACQDLVQRIGLLRLAQPVVLSIDALCGQIDCPGSLPVLRALLSLMGDSSRRHRRRVRLSLRVGPATSGDPEGYALLERATARALTDGTISFAMQRTRIRSQRGNLFGEGDQSQEAPGLLALPSRVVLNLTSLCAGEGGENLLSPVDENAFFLELDQRLNLCARALQERDDFLTRFLRRKRFTVGGLTARFGECIGNAFLPSRVEVAGLRQAAQMLAGPKAGVQALQRAAQRVVYYLGPRLRELADSLGTLLELSGRSDMDALHGLARRQTGSIGSVNAALDVFPECDWHERADLEAPFHPHLADACLVLDASTERISQAGLQQLLTRAAAGRALPLEAISVHVPLRTCRACASQSPPDVPICPACGASDWYLAHGQRSLFEDGAALGAPTTASPAGDAHAGSPPQAGGYQVM